MATYKLVECLVVLEEHTTFAEASSQAKRLASQYSEVTRAKRTEKGFAVLISAQLLANIRAREASAVSSFSMGMTEPPIAPSNGKVSATNGSPPSHDVMRQLRLARMAGELRHAIDKAPATEIRAWVNHTLRLFGVSFARRVGNFVDLGLTVFEVVGREIIDITVAVVNRNTNAHITALANKSVEVATNTMKQLQLKLRSLVAAFREDPRGVGPDMLVAALSFYFAGGGLDGDGGVPDLDISMLGIGAHRSLFTHSILSGAVIETGLYSLVDLVGRVHKQS